MKVLMIKATALVVAFLGSVLIRYLLHIEITGISWKLNIFFAEVTFDPLASTYFLLFFIFEAGYVAGVKVGNKPFNFQ